MENKAGLLSQCIWNNRNGIESKILTQGIKQYCISKNVNTKEKHEEKKRKKQRKETREEVEQGKEVMDVYTRIPSPTTLLNVYVIHNYLPPENYFKIK